MLQRTALFAAVAALFIAGCASAPKTQQKQEALEARAQSTLQTMVAQDPTLRPVLEQAVGYAVFPEITKGGVLVGGATGEGVVYQQGQVIGYAELDQASLGAQLGGQTLAELIVFQNEEALQRLKAGNFSLGAEASAVAVRSGAARSVDFEGGSAVFLMTRGGLMAGLSVSGQQINFQPGGPPRG